MDADLGPNVRRRQLGKLLKKKREGAGKTLEMAAKFVGLTVASVSRIENGKQAILPRNVRLFCQCYDVGAPEVDMLVRMAKESNDSSWYSMYSDVVPNWADSYFGLEAEAAEIWAYESELPPGWLQLPTTTAALRRAALWNSPPGDLEQSVALRSARQARLESKKLRLVVNEAVIRRPVGGLLNHAEQLEHYRKSMKHKNVGFRILPFESGEHPAMTGAFTMLRFPDELEMNAIFLEHDHGATSAERPADLERYGAIFERIWSMALNPVDTDALLASLAAQYYSQANERGREGGPQPEAPEMA